MQQARGVAAHAPLALTPATELPSPWMPFVARPSTPGVEGVAAFLGVGDDDAIRSR